MKVLLGGDGGNEIFGGNKRYVTNLVFERYFLLPRIVRSLILEPLVSRLPAYGPIHKGSRYIRRATMLNPNRFFSYNHPAEGEESLHI